MNETQPIVSVTEALSVDENAQGGERRAKNILWVVALVLLIGGLSSIFLVKKSEPFDENAQPAVTQQAPAQAIPASAPKGKDFGL